MAYQDVGTPRFYINIPEWLDATGQASITPGYRTLPVSSHDPSENFYYHNDAFHIPLGILDYESSEDQVSFGAFLGHNMRTIEDATGVNQYPWLYLYEGSSTHVPATHLVNEVFGTIPYDGFTIKLFNGSDVQWISSGSWSNSQSVVFGSFYDMPTSPDLSLTMSREYGETKEIRTINGHSISNTMGNKPPMWGNGLGAWELSNTPVINSRQIYSRSGRRTWDLKFSFLSDKNIAGITQMLNIYSGISGAELSTAGYSEGNSAGFFSSSETLLKHNNFFSQVWHKTLGGTLPFIFQPDNSNFNPDQFSICKVAGDFKVNMVAFNVYDISLSIEEVW